VWLKWKYHQPARQNGYATRRHATIQTAQGPAPSPEEPLTELLRRGARELIHQTVEAELQTYMGTYAQDRLSNGRQAIVHNGYQPQRQVQTGIVDVAVQVPKTRGSRRERETLHAHAAASVSAPNTLGRGAAALALPQRRVLGRLTGGAQRAARRTGPGVISFNPGPAQTAVAQ